MGKRCTCKAALFAECRQGAPSRAAEIPVAQTFLTALQVQDRAHQRDPRDLQLAAQQRPQPQVELQPVHSRHLRLACPCGIGQPQPAGSG